MSPPTIVFAGDRQIAVDILEFLTKEDVTIAALLLPKKNSASHDDDLLDMCGYIDENRILRGGAFREPEGKEVLTTIDPDYILSIHYQYIYPKEILEIPTHGVVNLHPAYLPYNRGWHTPSWAILEETPYGATLHFMEEDIDSGDIIARKQIEIQPDDTADSLYGRVLDAEFELFKQTWADLSDFSYDTTPQSEDRAASHKKDELQKVQEIDLDNSVTAREIIRKLRALTTNKMNEAAYYEVEGEKYRIQVNVVPESELE